MHLIGAEWGYFPVMPAIFGGRRRNIVHLHQPLIQDALYALYLIVKDALEKHQDRVFVFELSAEAILRIPQQLRSVLPSLHGQRSST
jgi:hypothetical protein